jgi:hypothetical protein
LAISFEWQVIGLSYFIIMCVRYDKTFWMAPNGTKVFDLVTLTLKFDTLFKNFNIGHIFWMVSDMASVFHMHVTCDKTFILEP